METPWYKKWWSWLIIIFVVMALIFVIPYIINEAYKTPDGYITIWGAKETLLYYGAVLTLLGTSFLGLVALKQNKDANTTNKQLMELTQKSTNAELITKYNSTVGFYSIIFAARSPHSPHMFFSNAVISNRALERNYFLTLLFDSPETILINQVTFRSMVLKFDTNGFYELVSPIRYIYNNDNLDSINNNEFSVFNNDKYNLNTPIRLIFNFYGDTCGITNIFPEDATQLEVMMEISVRNIFNIETDLYCHYYFEKYENEHVHPNTYLLQEDRNNNPKTITHIRIKYEEQS